MKLTKTGQKIRLLIIGVLASLGLALGPGFVAMADNVVEGFSAEQTLQPGLVVALDSSAQRTVKAAPADKPGLIYGVVIDPSDAPITLVGQNSKVFVATSGTYQVLTSVINGPVKVGDYISMSTVNGVAAKALSNQSIILGKATSAFNGTSGVATDNAGKPIGRVLVNINVQKNPLAVTDPELPGILKRAADSIANRSVPVIRVYTALFIFLISLVATVTILWSGVRSSIISIGRNPLSRKSIFSGMYKVVFTGLGVFIIGVAGVYLLLKV